MFENKFMLGADPEIFLFDENKIPKSAIGIIEGSKSDPHKISDTGHSVQVDNVLLEFNVPPSTTSTQMSKDIDFVMSWFYNNIPKGCSLEIISSIQFPESELNCEEACEFGCDPDYDAWKEGINLKPNPEDKLLRSAGGHVHISYPNFNMKYSLGLIKALDLFLGVPSVIYDNDKRRRELYGKAGAFRFKTYGKESGGVEYRTLSNFWIKDPKYVDLVFKQVNKAFSYMNTKGAISAKTVLGVTIQDVINTGDVKGAEKLIKEHNIL